MKVVISIAILVAAVLDHLLLEIVDAGFDDSVVDIAIAMFLAAAMGLAIFLAAAMERAIFLADGNFHRDHQRQDHHRCHHR